MMKYLACIFEDDHSMPAVREQLRPQHHAFLRQHASEIFRAGALCPTPNTPPTGALWLLNAGAAKDAVSLIEQDPYFNSQHRKYRLFEWRWALNYPIDIPQS